MIRSVFKSAVFGFILMIFIAGLAITSEDIPASQVELKLKLQKGQQFRIRLENELHRTGGELKKGEDFKFERELGFTVEDVNDKGMAKIKVTFAKLAYDITRETSEGSCGAKLTEPVWNNYKYDSTKQLVENDPNIWAIAASCVGEHFFVAISQKGQIKKFWGLEEMQSRIAEKAIDRSKKDLINRLGEKYEKMRTRFEELQRVNTKGQYSESELRRILTDVFWIWPEGFLKIGQSWAGDIGIWSKNNHIPAKYTLNNDANGVLFILFEGCRTANDEPFRWVNNEGQEVGFKIVGSCRGELQVDKKTGLVMRAKVESEFAGGVVDGEKKEEKPFIEKEIIELEQI